MKTVYDTTWPTWFDTKARALGKLLQEANAHSAVKAGLVASPNGTNTNPGPYDTEVRTLQKQLRKLQ